ncbi:MAG TPA: polyphenol oxidase family protein [Candidatus Andersenbacteria bacterium]|nr:polyphenol oxidase family protein [Candidatus Andersenbacteria bacterium]
MSIQVRKLGNWRIAIGKKDDFLNENVIFPRLLHGGEITSATICISGETVADGIEVSQAHVKVGVGTADCMPLVILSPKKGLVLHVSRKSLINGLLEKASRIVAPHEITRVFIGPSICSKHFTFNHEGEEITTFKKLFPEAVKEKDTIHLSLSKAVQTYFDVWGVSEKSIFRDERCTFEDHTLSSYRRWLTSEKKGSRSVETATVIWREE